jgi:hypothetical protein
MVCEYATPMVPFARAVVVITSLPDCAIAGVSRKEIPREKIAGKNHIDPIAARAAFIFVLP